MYVQRNIKKQIGETVELSLNKPSKDMWDKILGTFKEALSKAEEAYIRKATSAWLSLARAYFRHPLTAAITSPGFNCTAEENEEALTLLCRRSWLALRAKIDEQTAESIMLVKLKLLFEDQFRYDDEGVPRVWKPDDDIDAIFKKAKEAVR